jgi:hypothetical protein
MQIEVAQETGEKFVLVLVLVVGFSITSTRTPTRTIARRDCYAS